MKYLLAMLPILLVMGCKEEPKKPNPVQEIGCAIGKGILVGLSHEIATQLECTNALAIQAKLVEALVKVKVCRESESSVSANSIGSNLCESVGGYVTASLVNGAIPVDWGCSANSAKERLAAVIKKACSKL